MIQGQVYKLLIKRIIMVLSVSFVLGSTRLKEPNLELNRLFTFMFSKTMRFNGG